MKRYLTSTKLHGVIIQRITIWFFAVLSVVTALHFLGNLYTLCKDLKLDCLRRGGVCSSLSPSVRLPLLFYSENHVIDIPMKAVVF
jgi:hypothetical protein